MWGPSGGIIILGDTCSKLHNYFYFYFSNIHGGSRDAAFDKYWGVLIEYFLSALLFDEITEKTVTMMQVGGVSGFIA